MRLLYLTALFLLLSCRTTRLPDDERQAPLDAISFLVLHIDRQSATAIPQVTLVSKTAGSGTMKKRSGSREALTANFLTIYLFSDRQLMDSLRLAHPLYKHYEYPDEQDQLVAKDTIMDKADFIVRFQTPSPVSHITIKETRSAQSARTIGTIKL